VWVSVATSIDQYAYSLVSNRRQDVCYVCHKVSKKRSKIVHSGEPLLNNSLIYLLRLFALSFGRHTRHYLTTVPTVNSEILVGRQDDGICKRFRQANEARIGETHRNV